MSRSQKHEVLQVDTLTLDTRNQLVTNGKKRAQLNRYECRLLSVFVHHPTEVLARLFLSQAARDWETSNLSEARTLEVHVCWLRRKLEDDPRHPLLIRTVRGGVTGLGELTE